MDLDLKALGKRIAHHREKQGLRQIDLAEKAEINEKYISSIENAKPNVSLNYTFRIAQVLGVSISELVGDVPKPLSTESQTDDEFLALYRSADSFTKTQIRKVVEILLLKRES